MAPQTPAESPIITAMNRDLARLDRASSMYGRATIWFFAMFVPAMVMPAPGLLLPALAVAALFLGIAVWHMIVGNLLSREVDLHPTNPDAIAAAQAALAAVRDR